MASRAASSTAAREAICSCWGFWPRAGDASVTSMRQRHWR